ncbi:MAG: AAA family ATPase [Parabacteroides sp.]|nr:AAA family ATPase [Parabacteroides sp.]MCI7007834.1 AAA family ATPase [Parabacteroides sp.]
MKEELYIEHFGPIIEARVPINKITVLIGRQGSGKSTIAKLYSLFVWMEKSLMRHSLTKKYII